jgi:hypothetical protein
MQEIIAAIVVDLVQMARNLVSMSTAPNTTTVQASPMSTGTKVSSAPKDATMRIIIRKEAVDTWYWITTDGISILLLVLVICIWIVALAY